MMTPVVSLIGWVVVVPLAIVNWNLHFYGVAMVQAITARVVFGAVEVLWIIDIWGVVETLVVTITRSSTPCPAVSLWLLSLCFF